MAQLHLLNTVGCGLELEPPRPHFHYPNKQNLSASGALDELEKMLNLYVDDLVDYELGIYSHTRSFNRIYARGIMRMSCTLGEPLAVVLANIVLSGDHLEVQQYFDIDFGRLGRGRTMTTDIKIIRNY